MPKLYSALGLMSGTSLDAVDVAWLETDGEGVVIPRGFFSSPYDASTRDAVRKVFGVYQGNDDVRLASQLLTNAHVKAISEFLSLYHLDASHIDLIGFHGQTITHDPKNGFTWQIGDAQILANQFGCNVVADFRSADVKAGGEGAPLLPLYHHARIKMAAMKGGVGIVNIGGVSNITYINGDEILAFDCGPGNALIDDVILKRRGIDFDKDGALASTGNVQEDIVQQWLSHPYFSRPAPKSLDRNAWDIEAIEDLSDEDALASLTHFTARAIAKSCTICPQKPEKLYITGGGRHNRYLMELIAAYTNIPTVTVETLGWNGDALEAEGFAYLAVRSLKNLPLSLPTTTGVKAPQTGGVLFTPHGVT